MKEEYVYLLKLKETPIFKIGYTSHFYRRFSSLSRQHIFDLDNSYVVVLPSGQGLDFERTLHKLFNHQNVTSLRARRREYFHQDALGSCLATIDLAARGWQLSEFTIIEFGDLTNIFNLKDKFSNHRNERDVSFRNSLLRLGLRTLNRAERTCFGFSDGTHEIYNLSFN